MRTKRQVSRQRALLGLIVILLGLIGGLGWWQASARRADRSAPYERLLREFLSPAVHMAGQARNLIVSDATPPAEPGLSPVNQARLRALEEENRQLRALLHLRDTLPAGALVAEVIGRPGTPWQGYLTLDKGVSDGVAQRMIALTPDGVLGEVVDVSRDTASILPLTDTASGIGALIERTHTPAVLQGDRDGLCQLRYLPDETEALIGDRIVTSGLGDVYPKGLPLGRITAIRHEAAVSTRIAVVQPLVNLARVEMVVLIRRAP